jgi:hypothetical protein
MLNVIHEAIPSGDYVAYCKHCKTEIFPKIGGQKWKLKMEISQVMVDEDGSERPYR